MVHFLGSGGRRSRRPSSELNLLNGNLLNGKHAGRLARCRAVEKLNGVRPEVHAAIEASLDKCLKETNFRFGNRTVGKVRDTYYTEDALVVVTTDRQSAFDRHLASVPFKGQVLNQTAAWWFAQTADIVDNAVISTPDPNVTVMRPCTVFPVEFVVRGYMTGSTETSLWTHYKNGARVYGGNALPEGMRKNARLDGNIITPTTKSVDRDVPITPAEIVAQGLMSQEDWDAASAAALKLFAFGQQEAARRGLLLVDTKYEFGKDADGKVLLIDEIHTPDSSRYWLADTYEARHAAGEEPQSIDKEFLRLWFRDNCDPYADATLPAAPPELVAELSARYVLLYETITGQQFEPPDGSVPAHERIAASLKAAALL